MSALPPRGTMMSTYSCMRDQLADRGAIGGCHDLHRGLGQPGGAQSGAHAGGDGLVRVQRFRAAAQDAGVAGFEAQPGGVGGHVRARLVDDADHAERHAHAADLDAARAAPTLGDHADRIGQLGDLLEPSGHLLDRLFAQCEPIDERRVAALRPGVLDVGAVRFAQLRDVHADLGRHRTQRLVLALGARAGEGARRRTRRHAELAHGAADVDLFRVKRLIHGPILTPGE